MTYCSSGKLLLKPTSLVGERMFVGVEMVLLIGWSPVRGFGSSGRSVWGCCRLAGCGRGLCSAVVFDFVMSAEGEVELGLPDSGFYFFYGE
jgi:hypothetical protein